MKGKARGGVVYTSLVFHSTSHISHTILFLGRILGGIPLQKYQKQRSAGCTDICANDKTGDIETGMMGLKSRPLKKAHQKQCSDTDTERRRWDKT